MELEVFYLLLVNDNISLTKFLCELDKVFLKVDLAIGDKS
jgi:hypothetical protein